MAIRIEQINIENLGPIQRTSLEFDDINLIYSKNEGGKSLLVEFIVRSLFSKKALWGYNREYGQGKIIVSGIDGNTKNYSPGSRDKLDKYFEKTFQGLPPSLAKLLVIKSGEPNISENPEGVDTDTLKELLFAKNMLDDIDKNISATVKNATIDEGKINIKRAGEGSEYFNLQDALGQINKTISRLSEENRISEERKLKIELDKLKEQKETLIKAKYHKAYLLDKRKEELENALEKYPEDDLERIKNGIDRYNKLVEKKEEHRKRFDELNNAIKPLEGVRSAHDSQLKAKRHLASNLNSKINRIEQELDIITDDDLGKLENKIINYNEKIIERDKKSDELEALKEKEKAHTHVQSIKDTYQTLTQSAHNQKVGFSLLLLAAIVFMTGLTISFVTRYYILGSVLMLIGFGCSVFFSYHLRKRLRHKVHSDELEKLESDFRKKFDTELNLAGLDTIIKMLEKELAIQQRVQNEQNELENTIGRLRAEIESGLFQLFSQPVDQEEWGRALNEFKQGRNDLKAELGKLEKQLAGLNVDPSDYDPDDPGEEYSAQKLSELEEKVQQLKSLEEEKQRIEAQLERNKKELEEVSEQISEYFFHLLRNRVGKDDWENKLNELIEQNTRITNEINNLSGELTGLGVNPAHYIENDPGIAYDAIRLSDIEREIQALENKLKALEEENRALKGDVAKLVDASINDDWNTIIEKLYEKQKETLEQLKQKEASIVAGILVHQTIDEFQSKEDERLQATINSPDFSRTLLHITGRYDKLMPDGDRIMIGSDMGDFDMKDLSTGAKEQVLFALRVSLAKKIMDNSAFFILDDAFQHSDYDRRPKLIDQLFDLSDAGWQIIYLTMDDHIRNLFLEKASHRNHFKQIVLT
jgi:DNA repair exonuclease SbcCD ATPase subunit